MTCGHYREEDKLSACIETTPSCIHKKKLKPCFCVEHARLDLEFPNLLFPLKYHPKTLERQLNYPKYYARMSF